MIWIKGEGGEAGVEDIISFPHCRRQYADETMKDGKKPSCQSPTILFHLTKHQWAMLTDPQKNPHTPTLQPQCTTVLHNADLCQHCNRKLFHRPYERRKNKHVEGSRHKYKCPASQNNINSFYKGYVYLFLLTDPNECSTIYSYPIVSFIISVT